MFLQLRELWQGWSVGDRLFYVVMSIGIVGCLIFIGVLGYQHFRDDETPSDDSSSSSSHSSQDSGADPEESTPADEDDEAPTYPHAGEENTIDGAQAVVKYWYEAKNYAIDTLDTGPLEKASHQACSYCQSVIDAFQKSKSDGETLSGGRTKVTKWWREPYDVSDSLHQYIELSPQIHEEDWVIYKNGSEIDRVSGGEGKRVVQLGYFDSKWVVVSMNPRDDN